MSEHASNGTQQQASQSTEILRLLRTGRATSRATLAKAIGLSPSTVASRVELLIERGHVVEVGEGQSQGGRRPRHLKIRADAGLVGCVDLGVDRASFGLADFAGALIAERHVDLDIASGPEEVLSYSVSQLQAMTAEVDTAIRSPLRAISVGVPGPVSSTTSRIIGPSRMPGWNGVSVEEFIHRDVALPVMVNNDANLMAVGELLDGEDLTTFPNQIFVKAGSGIGCGIITDGELYTGSNGWAGDISHVSLQGAPATPCACGRIGCLDVLASGNALVREMQLSGHDVQTVEGMIALARDSHPDAIRLLRAAGVRTGGVLATIINFFNPDRLVLGGVLAESAVFVAGVRSTLYSDCPPMATEQLVVEVAKHSPTAGLRGAARVMLDELFSTEAVMEL